MLCDSRLWAAQQDALGPDVVYLPLAGTSMAAAVDSVLALPVPRFDLAGLSLGGIVAMHVAVRAPHRVARLALLSTNARAPRPDQYRGWDVMRHRALADELRGVASDLLPALLRPSAQRDRDLVGTTLAMAEAVGVAAFLAQLDVQRSRTDLRPALGAVPCPTLVVSAADDVLCPPALHEEIAEALPRGRLETIPDCGHLSTLERPDVVTGLLRRWLAAPDEPAVPASATRSRA
jgi:pimeloyl-ACP methyl ester carboxylesterase